MNAYWGLFCQVKLTNFATYHISPGKSSLTHIVINIWKFSTPSTVTKSLEFLNTSNILRYLFKIRFPWPVLGLRKGPEKLYLFMMMMMMMMMMSCFCGMVDRQKVYSLISSRDHCQISSPSRISNMPRTGFEPVKNLSWGFVEWNCAVLITTTPRRHELGNVHVGGIEKE